MTEPAQERVPTIKELFPKLSEDQLTAVEETLYRYCEIALRILDRLEHEKSSRDFDGEAVNS